MMKPVELLFLSQEDIIRLGFTMKDAIDIVADVLIEHGRKRYENPPKPGVHPRHDGFIHAMPAYLPRQAIAGMKWISGFSSNPVHGLPSIMGLIILNDAETGQPLVAMEGGLITAMRTAAVSAVATRHLAKPGASIVGIIGAGMQGRYHLSALRKVMPDLAITHVFDIHQPTLDDYVHRFREIMPFEINPAASIEAVIKNSDIVVTATGKLDQILYRAEWVGAGALVLPVHMFGWNREAIADSDKFIVDDWDQFRSYMALHGQNYLPLPHPDAELGEIVIRAKTGRLHASERIINFNLGLALHDIAIANHIFTQAKQSGMGTHVTLMSELPPFVM